MWEYFGIFGSYVGVFVVVDLMLDGLEGVSGLVGLYGLERVSVLVQWVKMV